MLIWDTSFPLIEIEISKENEKESIPDFDQESPANKIRISIRDRRCWQKRCYSDIATTTLML
ncbi:hypothetical protein [Brevibacillus laterosporus]|uniref:hypothetical protein n=1 Tax=Brevibacillus laterosporus TaxID=1465 RepID=UPI000839C1D3|nr:hypothetical protein [Brevibacillus laterosporus]